MSEQFQCPNCGGYRVSVDKPPVNSLAEASKMWLVWFFITIFTFGLGLLAFIPWAINRNKRIKSGDTSWYCACQLCGYRWSWSPGTPLPSVNVRPDLIKAGEQRLREEEERRRRALD